LFATLVALSSTSSAVRPRIPFPVRAFPRITGPLRLATEVHPPMEWIPCRVSRYLPAVRPVGRTDFLEISRPSNGIPWASPAWTGRHHRPVPLSGFATLRPTSSQRFPGRPKVCGRVSDRTVLGIPPFRVFPSQQVAYASRRSLAPLRLSSGVQKCTTRVLVTCSFPDVRAFTQLPGSPAGYELPFHAPKHASRSPWVSRRGTTRSTSITRFEASIPPASPFATGSGLPSPTGRYPPGFLPL
jgi:hypothetical protein